MKKYLTLFTLLLSSTLMVAQENQEKLNALKAPSSPAASILGFQPSSVMTPKSYQTLEVALFNNFISNGSAVIPDDFALEFTPYWAVNNGLSLKDYMYPTVGQQVIRNSSISIASTQKFMLGDSTATNGIALGYRSTIYLFQKRDEKRKDLLGMINDLQLVSNSITSHATYILTNNPNIKTKADLLPKLKKEVENDLIRNALIVDKEKLKVLVDAIFGSYSNLPELDPDAPDLFLDQLSYLIDDKMKGDILFEKLKTYIRNRHGLSVDIAWATLLNFPTGEFDFSEMPRHSFWITPTYRFENKKFEFLKVMGVLKYERYNTDYYQHYFPELNIFKNNLDYGLALSGEFNKLSLQIELVGRHSNSVIPAGKDTDNNDLFRIEKDTDLQYLCSINYNISDQVNLSYNIGNRFGPIQNPTNTLVSQLSLNFGVGSPNKKSLDFLK